MAKPGNDKELHEWPGLDGEDARPENARQLIQAMRESGEALTPSEQTRQIAWAQVEKAMAAKQQQTPGSPWFSTQNLFRFLMPGMATAVLVLGAGVMVWSYLPSEPEYIELGSKGPPSVVATQDFSLDTPALVTELSHLGLTSHYRHDTSEGTLTIQVPNPPPHELLHWASRWNLLPPEPGVWNLKVVPAPGSPP